ncbi:exodeoxyribonuclease VII large subunit, partial [Bacteroides cellulosilyticus]
MEALSLLELNALVRRSLEQCLPDEYWVQAELSDVRTNSTGNWRKTSKKGVFDTSFFPGCRPAAKKLIEK